MGWAVPGKYIASSPSREVPEQVDDNIIKVVHSGQMTIGQGEAGWLDVWDLELERVLGSNAGFASYQLYDFGQVTFSSLSLRELVREKPEGCQWH